jgi:hypothetical protein
MRIRFFLFFALMLFASRDAVFSQIMNIEQERIKTDTTGWEGKAKLSFVYMKNDKELFSGGAYIHLQYKTKKSLFLLLTDYNVTKTSGEDFENAGVEHFRYNYKIKDWLTAEAFTQAQFNKLLKVKFRWLVGAGPRLKLVQTKPFRMYLGALYMFEYETLDDTNVYNKDHRLSSYLSFTLKLRDNLSIINTTYYQPKFSNFKDYRISSQTNLKIGITKHFAFEVSYIYYIDKFPALGVPNETHYFSNALVFDF